MRVHLFRKLSPPPSHLDLEPEAVELLVSTGIPVELSPIYVPSLAGRCSSTAHCCWIVERSGRLLLSGTGLSLVGENKRRLDVDFRKDSVPCGCCGG